MDSPALQQYLSEKFQSSEERCRRCGVCCGLGNDPCSKLIESSDGRYFCSVYDNRIGLQKTVSEKNFIVFP